MSASPVLINHLKGHKNTITSLVFNPSGDQVASSSLDGSVTINNLHPDNIRCLRFEPHTDEINDVDWSPKGDLLASVSKDRIISVWQPTIVNGVCENFRAHTSNIRSVHFNSTGRRVSIN